MPDPIDPRTVANGHTGHTMRDAAVTPLSKDFLAPTNAGVAGPNGNPHGPKVVSPGIHALDEVHAIPSGPVSSTPATQQAKELADLKLAQPQVVIAP